MKPKIRHLLCEDCKKIIREFEEKYREKNKEKIKQNRRNHYLTVEPRKARSGYRKVIKGLDKLKEAVDKMSNAY